MNPQQVMASTGGYLNAANLLNVPNMRSAYGELLAKVQALAFVPVNWLADVKKLMADAGPEYAWMPRHAINAAAARAGKDGPLLADIPPWLEHDTNAAHAWNALTDWWNAKFQPILAGWARDQMAIVESANNDAMFWNGLYTVVKPVAVVGDAIISAPEKVGEVVSRSFFGALRGFAPILIVAAVVGVGFLVYKTGAYKRFIK